MNPKISDFGWSNYFSTDENRESLCGTYDYMAFEIFKGEPQTLKTDIWALGIILYEFFHKRSPFGSRNMPDIIKKIKNPEKYLLFDDHLCPKDIQLLIASILKSEPTERPDIHQIMEHSIFKGYDPKEPLKN